MYFLKVYLKTQKMKMLFTELCLTLCHPMDCSPPGPSVRGILQARTPEGVVIPSSRASSRPRDQTRISCITGRYFTTEPLGKPSGLEFSSAAQSDSLQPNELQHARPRCPSPTPRVHPNPLLITTGEVKKVPVGAKLEDWDCIQPSTFPKSITESPRAAPPPCRGDW